MKNADILEMLNEISNLFRPRRISKSFKLHCTEKNGDKY